MKKLVLLLSLVLVFAAQAKVKVNDVELAAQDAQGKITVSISGTVKGSPEISIKNSVLQLVIPDSVVWPKIEKKVSVTGADFDTTLMAYQFDKESVRIRAVLPYSLTGKEKQVSVSIKDGKVELTFPRQGQADVPKAAQVQNERKPAIEKLDESYLQKLMDEKEEGKAEAAPKADEKVALNDAQQKPTEDKVKTAQSSVKKESNDAFSFTTYVGKFVAFLGLVLLLFYGAVNLLKKGVLKKSKIALFQNMKAIEVLNTTYIGPKKNLMMVKAHNQVFLIGTSEAGIQFLSEIKDVTGLIKNGEKDEIGDNFDMNLDTAEIAGKEMKLKEAYNQQADFEEERTARPQGKLDNFLADAPVKEVKDQVKFSDQIRNKIKGMRPLQ